MDWLVDLLPRLAIVAVVALAVSFLWAFGAKILEPLNKPLRQSSSGGVIRPWPPIWWLCTLFFAAMFVVAIVGVGVNTPWWLLGVALFGVLTAYSGLYGLPQCELRWNNEGVEGLSSQMGFGRRQLSWVSIVKSGVSGGGLYYLQDHRGDRVYWTWTHIGHLYFWDVFFQRRPDLGDNIQKTLSTPTG